MQGGDVVVAIPVCPTILFSQFTAIEGHASLLHSQGYSGPFSCFCVWKDLVTCQFNRYISTSTIGCALVTDIVPLEQPAEQGMAQ